MEIIGKISNTPGIERYTNSSKKKHFLQKRSNLHLYIFLRSSASQEINDKNNWSIIKMMLNKKVLFTS